MNLRDRDYVYAAGQSDAHLQHADERSAADMRIYLTQQKPLLPTDEPVKVRCLVPFRAGSPIRALEIGETISVPGSLSRSLAAIGRCEILK